jgi:hypothetical protein
MNGELLLHMAAPLDDYVLACDLGDRFAPLRVLPKRYDHGWPRYRYRNRSESFDVASLRRLCATS